ncbi:MAG: hypothetical protein OXI27_00155 [Thaumarchaeota archaeon]|nr:hypothetical protein [Nitrososphaerota archaeon]
MLGEESERYIALLLGVKDKPIPSMWHLQKEMFIASRAVPKINEIFGFEKHYHGPYSQTLQEVTEEPLHLDNVYKVRQDGTVSITQSGKDYFNKIVDQHKGNKRFASLLQALRLTRNVYDKLGWEELLFLIYMTYPDYADVSNIYDELVGNRENRDRLANSLFSKGLVTEERYSELRN